MDKLTCGFAQAVITPEPGTVYMDGYGFRVSPAEGVRDDLYAKVCAMKSGENEFVLVALDICGFDNRLRDCLRGWIRTYTDLERSPVLCQCYPHPCGSRQRYLQGPSQ